MTSGVMEYKTGPNILVRIVWYLLVGWWLTGLTMALAWGVALTVIGLPLSFYLVNRVPPVLTLRPRREQFVSVTDDHGVTRYQRLRTEQTTPLLRVLYFVLVGWWASAIFMAVAYLAMLTIVLIPVGLALVNRLPFVFSLHRGYA